MVRRNILQILSDTPEKLSSVQSNCIKSQLSYHETKVKSAFGRGLC